ncbi:MAG: patatin [Cytophagales bacterium]|nr:MAG: patatin [Cytophagales bacterium]
MKDDEKPITEEEKQKRIAEKDRLVRILSIDGGGIRGILAGQILVSLEERIRQRTGNPNAKIAEYFDLIAGTSTGGILACICLAPDPQNPTKPLYSAQEAVQLYMKNGKKIFTQSTWHKIRTLFGIIEERFPSRGMEEVLKDYLGDLELKDLVKPCLITSYDIEQGKPNFFSQHKARKDPNRNFLVREVARATSAAPTYFELALATSKTNIAFPLIDGGVFANNPTLCAYAEARQLDFGLGREKPSAREMFIFSLGTGTTDKSYKYKKVKKWGVLEWIKPLIDIMMDGVSQTVDYQLRQIYDAINCSEQYVRINPGRGGARSDMDDAEDDNLNALLRAGYASSETHSRTLDRVVEVLLQNHTNEDVKVMQ